MKGTIYVIRHRQHRDLFWSNEWGYIEENFDLFSERDKLELNLPIHGEWVVFQQNKLNEGTK